MKTPLTPAQVLDAPLPAVYEQAKAALTQCETIDECKDWSDRAAALASYAKQANDETLEKKARLIRNRAIRRMGQVLEQIEPATGAHLKRMGTHTLSRTEAAAQAGLSNNQKATALRLAKIPENEFEKLTKRDGPQPTVTELAERGTQKREVIVIDHTGGRDPKVFNRIIHFTSALECAVAELSGNADLLEHMLDWELAEALEAAARLRLILDNLEEHKCKPQS
ncbi:hypothetical protein [Parasedimentitalea psychrophila]|uniref:Uncharacterized protein n=1 Tax=Parasedimentitalea psychrophila TaxID=2997337 RepID=A0A9Y2P1M5_9RHOB|nr:hypothetical protein [Parasedimentitalea psychrophila]WIY24242.1 hypothetical protein QPJ95_16790 [Parasedimentitalea psychrophila]